jgi:hypothetical protein
MISVNNSSDTVQLVNGYYCPPGFSVIPGETGVAYVSPTGAQEIAHPQYFQSFGMGMLLMVPFCGILVIRRILTLLKPTALDRYL